MKKVSVSIGIPVYNESQNIGNLLFSILRQRKNNYRLENIYVICDGSSDDTPRLVKAIAKKHPCISVVIHKQRHGKKKRLMELYALNKSDIIITCDGDIALSDRYVFKRMISYFKYKKIVLVSANNQPVAARNIIEKLIITWSKVWYEVRVNVNNGDNPHNVRGCTIALKKEFSKSIIFPKHIISDARFLYFSAKFKNLSYVFAKDAVVYYRKPDNIYDYFAQTKRSVPGRQKFVALFGEWVYKMYEVPLFSKIKAILNMLLREPLYSPLAGLFYLTTRLIPYKRPNSANYKVWKTVKSTKSAIMLAN